MKNFTLAGTILILVIAISSCSKDNDGKEKTTALETGYTHEEILNVAQANLPAFKTDVLLGDVSNYGFNSPAELNEIQIGTPFLELHLKIDFKNDSVYDCLDKYVVKGSDWQVPLMVNNEIRCFMHISVWDGSLSNVGWGGSEGAKRVDDCLKKYNIQGEDKYLIRDHLICSCEFAMQKTGGNFTIYPIGDSIYSCMKTYKVYTSFEDFFNSFEHEGCFSAGD